MSTHAEDILYIFSPAKICTVLQNVDAQKLEVPTAICIDRMQLAGGGGELGQGSACAKHKNSVLDSVNDILL